MFLVGGVGFLFVNLLFIRFRMGFYPKLLCLAPMAILLGIGGIIEPRLLKGREHQSSWVVGARNTCIISGFVLGAIIFCFVAFFQGDEIIREWFTRILQ